MCCELLWCPPPDTVFFLNLLCFLFNLYLFSVLMFGLPCQYIFTTSVAVSINFTSKFSTSIFFFHGISFWKVISVVMHTCHLCVCPNSPTSKCFISFLIAFYTLLSKVVPMLSIFIPKRVSKIFLPAIHAF